MTKKELVELLENFSDDDRIFVKDNSDGSYEEVTQVSKLEVFEELPRDQFDWAGSYTTYTGVGHEDTKISGILLAR